MTRARQEPVHPVPPRYGVPIRLVTIVLGAGALAALLRPPLVGFRPLGLGDLAHLLLPLLLIALFIERALEVFVTAWRAPGARELQDLVRRGAGADEYGRRPDQRLMEYRSRTQRLAFTAGAALGVAVALAGVRILQPLLDPTLLGAGADGAAVPGWQERTITAVDVLFTGAVLGGGSDGLHKLVKVFTDFVDAASATGFRSTPTSP